jgi:hypothetical protein
MLILYMLLFGVVYLAWYVSLWTQQPVCTKYCETLRECSGDHGSNYTCVRVKSLRHIQVFQWKIPNSLRPNETRQSKVNNTLICSTSRGSLTKNMSWQASESRTLLRRITGTVWECAKHSTETLAVKELAVASKRCTASHLPFHLGTLDQNRLCSSGQSSWATTPEVPGSINLRCQIFWEVVGLEQGTLLR